MKPGDRLTEKVTLGSTYGVVAKVPLTDTVIYIHPKGCFYTLEFQNALTGETFRQAFPMKKNGGVSKP